MQCSGCFAGAVVVQLEVVVVFVASDTPQALPGRRRRPAWASGSLASADATADVKT